MRPALPLLLALGPVLTTAAGTAQLPPNITVPAQASATALPEAVGRTIHALQQGRAGMAGVSRDEGHLWALGMHYRAELLGDGIDFTPFFGVGEPVTRHLVYRMIAAGRASAIAPVAAPLARTTAHLRTVFDRRYVLEVYDARADGVEQSFVFPQVPVGSGDLVVRGELTTNMELVQAAPDGLRFAGIAGTMTIGAVVGIDATGSRAAGTMSLEGTLLEMRLPASFVDSAVAPITLDPVYGGITTPAYADVYRPDVAYDESNDNWLLVWHQIASAGDGDIRGQIIAGDGSGQGGLLSLRTGTQMSIQPRVCNNNLRNRFVVGWQEDPTYTGTTDYDVYARSVSALDGTTGAVAAISTDPAQEYDVDLGGNRDTSTALSAPRVALGYSRDDTTGTLGADIVGAILTVNTDGTLTIHDQAPLGFPFDGRNVSISDATPDLQKWWFAYDAWHIDYTVGLAYPGTDMARDIFVDLRDTGLTSLTGGELRIADGVESPPDTLYWQGPFGAVLGGAVLSYPSIAGSGTEWVVAYMARPAEVPAANREIHAAKLEYAPRHNTLDLPFDFVTIAARTGNQTAPEVAWGAESVLIGYVDDGNNGNYYAYVWEGDLECNACGVETQVVPAAADTRWIAIATKTNGGNPVPDGELSLLVLGREGSEQFIDDVRFRSDDGITENLGGSCASGNDTHVDMACAVVGHGEHALRMTNARNDTNAMLVLGFAAFQAGCGGCSLRVDPFSGFVFAATTDAHGFVAVDLPIPAEPSLSGLAYLAQWLVQHVTAPGCSVLGADFTDAMRVTIQ